MNKALTPLGMVEKGYVTIQMLEKERKRYDDLKNTIYDLTKEFYTIIHQESFTCEEKMVVRRTLVKDFLEKILTKIDE